MDGNNNYEFIDGQSITGRNQLYEAVYDILAEGLQLSGQIDMQGNKIINLGTPTSSTDATTNAYVDAQISGGTSLPLNDIATNNPNTGNVAMNNYKLTGLANGSLTTDSCTYGQLQTEATTRATNDTALQGQIDQEIIDREEGDDNLQSQIDQEIINRQTADNNLQDQIDDIVIDSTNLVINSDIDLTNTYKVINSIAPTDPTDLTNKQYVDTALDDKVSLSVLDDYYTKGQTDVLLDDKASNTYVNSQLNNLQISIQSQLDTKANMETNPLASTYTLIGGDLYCAQLDYETAVAPQTTYRIYNLAYIDEDGDNHETSQPMSCRQVQDYANNRFYTKTEIDDNADKIYKVDNSYTKIQCNADNEITITSNNNEIATIKQAIGQTGYTPLLIDSTDRFQMTTGAGSCSIMSSKAQVAQPDLNVMGLYVGMSAGDDQTKNQISQIQINQGQALTLACGHFDSGSGMTNFSSLSNSSDSATQNILLLSGGTPMTDPTLNLYSTAYATALSQNIPIQFTGKTGYSTTTTISENNQFASKEYVDTQISGTDSKTIGQISVDNANDQNVQLNGYRIQGVFFSEVDASPQDAINYSQYNVLKGYVDTADESLQDQNDLKYENTTTLNNITVADGDVDLNNNKITNLATPTADTDACTKLYADSIVSGATSSIPVGTIIAWYSNSIPSGWLLCDGSSFSSVTYPDLFTILGTTTLPDFRGYFLRGRDASGTVDSTRAIGDIQTSANLAHTHSGTTDNNSANHLHTYTRYNTLINNVSQAGLNDNVWQGTSTQNTSSTGIHNHTFTTGSSGGTESRPINKAINYIIRAEITGSSQVSGYNIPAIENWDFGNLYKPINVINPTNPQDLVTLNYLETNYTDTSDLPTAIQTTGDSRYYLNTTTLNSITAPTGSVSLNSQKITNLANATIDSDALNRITADGRYYLATTTLNNITQATGNVNMGAYNIVNLGTPTADFHATTKSYVDTLVSGISTPSNITNGTVNLFYSSNQLRLRRNDASVQQLFDFDATSNLASTFYSNTHDYVSNSDASYLIRNSKTRNHFVLPTLFADLTTNVNANSASTNANTAQVYIGGNSSKDYALRVTSVDQDVEFQCKDLYLFGENTVQIGGNDLFSIGSALTTMAGYLDVTDEDEDGYSINSYWKIQATAYDLWVPVSHKRFKNDISMIYSDELENISFCRFKWNKQEIASLDEKTSKRIKEDEDQFGIIIEDNDIPNRYYKKSELLGYKTVDLQRLKDDMLQYCIKKIRDQQTTINSLQARLDQIEARLQIQIGGL